MYLWLYNSLNNIANQQYKKQFFSKSEISKNAALFFIDISTHAVYIDVHVCNNMNKSTQIKLFMKCFPYHFDFIEKFSFFYSVGFGRITMASVSNNLSVLNIRGEDSVFLGNESLERNFLLSVLKRLAYDYKLFIFPPKTRCVSPMHQR